VTKFQNYEGAIKPIFEVVEIEDINYLEESKQKY